MFIYIFFLYNFACISFMWDYIIILNQIQFYVTIFMRSIFAVEFRIDFPFRNGIVLFLDGLSKRY